MIELSQIINSMKGINEKKESKCGVPVCEYLLDPHDGLKMAREYFFTTPHINFIVQSEFIIVDLIFPKTGLLELRTAWNYLRKFGEQQTNFMDDEKKPVLEFTAIPIEYKGQYFCTLINPIYWALQPSDINSNINNSIRMLFEKAGVLIHEGELLDDVTIDNGHLYSFGSGFIFESLPGIVFAPIDLLVILLSGCITALVFTLLNKFNIS